jgi:serine/threonine protein kinase
MFEKIKELGVGSFGVVYLVKCTQNSVIRTDSENVSHSNISAVKASNARKTPAGSFIGSGGSVPGVTTRSMAAQQRN